MKIIQSLGGVILLLLLASGLNAQTGTDDVVYLNNGTFLRGKITELVPGKTLSITLTGKDTLVVMMEDVLDAHLLNVKIGLAF